MGDISPVLESFLAGQKQQTDILKTAHDLVNMQMERKQRQQEIDNTMKRFDISSKLESERVALEHDHATNEHNLQMINFRQQALENFTKGLTPPQMNNDASTTSVPGIPQGPGVQFPIPGVSNIPTPATPKAVQTIDSPWGKMEIPMPKTQQQINVENAQALLPVQRQQEQAAADIRGKEAVNTFNQTREPMYQAQIADRDKLAAQRETDFNARLQQQATLFQLGLGSKEDIAALKAKYEAEKRYGFQSPDEYKTSVANNVKGLLNGTLDPKDITLPQEKQDSIRELERQGGVIIPKGVPQKVMDHVEKADKFLADVPRLKELIGNNGRSGQFANLIRSQPIINLISDNASEFKSIVQPLTADMEGAQQISKSRGGTSPNLINMQKDILPRITDTLETVDRKVSNVLNEYLSAASAEMAALPPASKKQFFQRIIDEHPSLMHGDIGKHIVQAAGTGKWVNLSAK